MRIFVAVTIPQSVKRALWKIVEPKRKEFPFLKWVEPENWHITLKFLGETEEELVEKVKKSLKNVVKPLSPFQVKFSSFGSFPSKGNIKVLWLGLGKGDEEMTSLAKKVEDEINSLGFPKEVRAFTPHLTLARARRKERRQLSLEELGIKEARLTPFLVKEVVLMESKLRPEGPIYNKLEVFKLMGEK